MLSNVIEVDDNIINRGTLAWKIKLHKLKCYNR